MKEMIALIVAIAFFIMAWFLKATNHFDTKAMTVAVVSAILLGLAISNYDVIKRFKGLGIDMETARESISQAKDTAIGEIREDVENHKQTIELLTASMNEARKRLDEQDKALSTSIEKAQEQRRDLENQTRIAEAQSGSRAAYDQLRETARTDSGEVGKRAALVVKEIEQSHDFSAMYVGDGLICLNASQERVPVETLPSRDIQAFLQQPEPKTRKATLDELAKRKDRTAIPYIVEHLKKESDLRVCAAAVRALCEITGDKTTALDFDHWLNWKEK